MRIYRGIFADIETDPVTNANAQAEKRIDIIDTDSNQLGVSVTSEPDGPDTIYTFTFTPPAGYTGLTILASNDDGGSWINALVTTPDSPQEVTLATDNWIFQLVFVSLDLDPIIYFTEDDVVELDMADDPARLIVTDNDESKQTSIRSTQLEFCIHSSDAINIGIFAGGSDRRFHVKLYIDDELRFVGSLSTADLRSTFLPDPNIITLVAADGLGFLRDITLTNFAGNIPEGEEQILLFILWCLAKTGHELNLAVTWNIREETASDLNDDADGTGHLLKHCYIDAKIAEAGVNEMISCFEVLERILGPGNTLYQSYGEWRITRADEMEHGIPQYVYRWDHEGAFISKTEETNEANIGEGEEYSWMNDDQEVGLTQAVRKSDLTYRHEMPREVPCNINLDRGEFLSEPVAGIKRYDPECWEKLWSNTSTDDPQDTGIYIQKHFENGYETRRYLVFETNASRLTFVKSRRIPVQARDRANINVSRRIDADIGGSGFYRENTVEIRLTSHTGGYWTHRGGTSADPSAGWVISDSTFRTAVQHHVIEGDDSEDQTEAKSLYSGAVSEIPEDGYIEILIYSSVYRSSNGTYVDSVSFELIPFINGAHQVYSGQRWRVEQPTGTLNSREQEVYMSDSPHPIYKGSLLVRTLEAALPTLTATFGTGGISVPGDQRAIFKAGMYIVAVNLLNPPEVSGRLRSVVYHIIGDTTDLLFDIGNVILGPSNTEIFIASFPLAGLFYNAAQEATGAAFLKPYGELQAFDVWNQERRVFSLFDGEIDHTAPLPALNKKYFATDAHSLTNNRIFLLLHYEIDLHLCSWVAYLVECSNSGVGKEYTGQTFKYLSNNDTI